MINKSKVLKVGIIGSGFGLYGLLPAFSSLRTCQVVAICGKKNERLLKYSQSLGIKNIYTDWRLMLDREKIDILAIAVPPSIQYDIAEVAINLGINIFAEKPLANNLQNAKKLLALATGKRIHHMVDFLFPEIDEWKKVKKLLDKKVLGKLEHISVNWDFLSYDIKNKRNTWKTSVREGGGAVSFYFSHTLYYLEYFAGRIENLDSILYNSKDSLNGGEVGVDLMIRFCNKVNGLVHLSCNTKGLYKHQLIFECEKGTIVLESENNITDDFIIKLYTDSKIQQLITSRIPPDDGEDQRVKIVRKMVKKFIKSCINGKQVRPNFSDGVRVQELIGLIRPDF